MIRVVDASVIIGLIRGEKIKPEIHLLLEQNVFCSSVNYSESLNSLTQKLSINAAQADELVSGLGFTVVPFSTGQGLLSAQLGERTYGKGISFADRPALPLALR